MFKSLTPTLSIIAAIVLFMFFVRPQMAQIDVVNAQIDTYNQTIEQYRVFNQKVDSLLSEKNQVSISERERLDKMIPDQADATRTLVDLEALARKHNLLFGNVITGENQSDSAGPDDGLDKPSHELMKQDISFDVIGTYEQFKAFIAEVESSLELMEVTKLDLAAATESFQQYSITVQTYSLGAK